jgi:cardiolipin synthase A/B
VRRAARATPDAEAQAAIAKLNDQAFQGRKLEADGVDVRLLVPHGSDIEWIANVSRTMYRSLLEAGVRIYEWNGPMVHAKTAVATNLNVSSWLGNWELDVGIEDDGIAREMAAIFLDDLTNATEIVITREIKCGPMSPGPRRPPSWARARGR